MLITNPRTAWTLAPVSFRRPTTVRPMVTPISGGRLETKMRRASVPVANDMAGIALRSLTATEGSQAQPSRLRHDRIYLLG